MGFMPSLSLFPQNIHLDQLVQEVSTPVWTHAVHVSVWLAIRELVVDLRQLHAIIQDLVVAAVRVTGQPLRGLGERSGRDRQSVTTEGRIREALAHFVLWLSAQVVEVVLIHDARIRVTAHIHDDIGLCLVGIHVMEREEVVGFVLSHHFSRLALDNVKTRRLFVVPLHALVERTPFDLHREQRPDIHNEGVLDEHEVVGRHGEAVVVTEAIFRDKRGHDVDSLKRVWCTVSWC